MVSPSWSNMTAGYSTLEHYESGDDLPEVAHGTHGNYVEHLGSENLEVLHDAKNPHLPQVVSTTEYMHAVPLGSDPSPNYAYDRKEDFESTREPSGNRNPDTLICGLRRRIFWILAATAALLILVAALGGALGATVGKSAPNDSSDSKQNVVTTTTTSSSGTSTVSSAPAATTTGYTGLRSNSHLAAIAFNQDQGGQQYAVYYQDEKNSIKQSLWNSSLQSWNVSYVYSASDAMSGGSFGASVNFVGSIYQIELYYLGTDNTLKELYLTTDATTWKEGYATPLKYGASTNSSVVLSDNLCPQYCNNNLLAFWQDPNNDIRLGNSSVSAVIVQDALDGTPISATPVPAGDGPLSYALFYYDSDSQLQVSLWDPARVSNLSNSTGKGWSKPTALGSTSNIGHLTSFSSASSSDPTVTVLVSSQNGLQVISFSVDANGNVESPESQSGTILDSLTDYASIAVNTENQLFGIVNGTIEQYSMQGNSQTWSLVGTVPTK